jgi:hypothetical protein
LFYYIREDLFLLLKTNLLEENAVNAHFSRVARYTISVLNDTSHVLSLLVTEKNAHLTGQTYTLYNVFFKVFTEKKCKKQTDIV